MVFFNSHTKIHYILHSTKIAQACRMIILAISVRVIELIIDKKQKLKYTWNLADNLCRSLPVRWKTFDEKTCMRKDCRLGLFWCKNLGCCLRIFLYTQKDFITDYS